MYSPFDINEAVAHRKEFVEEGLRSGSPVVGLTYDGGLLLLTVRRTQRKVYEIYDRQMFSAIGRQSDIENVRLASIQNAHQEGFERSPDDVTLQRMVGFALSPALKKAFGDQMYVPVVIKALFAEIGRTPAGDTFFTLNYDGEFRQHQGVAAIAGTQTAEDRMLERIGEPDAALTRDEALRRALSAWSVGSREALRRRLGVAKEDDEEELNPLRAIDEADADEVFLRDELKTASVEVGLLERRTNRESRFRLLPAAEIDALTRDYR
jgi:proteasome alpha subunit